ncbi:kelch-like protein 23 isoform X2 [Zophobas morio]|uniref:kelch-like protein 23 isoform X2 n=1 Tax=Zophobas morio TaxID=2755281 RepID=UPI00308314E0
MNETVVTLEIQGTPIQCSRTDLIQNSDYFKAMFEGNFIESEKKVITLNEVEPEAMKTILKLLWDKEHVISERNILSVLQAACMLQFLQVKETCIEQVERSLSVNNCLKIWVHTEHLVLKNVYCKAKLLALMEFELVKKTDYFFELTLDEVVNYLGNVNLQCLSEFDVWETVVTWYENLEEQKAEVWLKLLPCINFTAVTIDQIDDMISSRCVAKHDFVCSVLRCVIAVKKSDDLYNFSEKCVNYAKMLLLSKERNSLGFPCILLDNVQPKPIQSTVYYYDKFKRKRKYGVLENNPHSDFFVVYVDVATHSLRLLFDIEPDNFVGLDGFAATGYKNFVFLYGGEYVLGKGKWNYDFHIYDIVSAKWKTKKLPFPRRHFESCVCGHHLYVVGGTGPFRVIQENLFYYDIQKEEWSKEIKLPCSGRQIKCCAFDNKLFILDINNKCVYQFNHDSEKWNKLEICDSENRLPFFSKNLQFFGCKSRLCIKGRCFNWKCKTVNSSFPTKFSYQRVRILTVVAKKSRFLAMVPYTL